MSRRIKDTSLRVVIPASPAKFASVVKKIVWR